MISGCTTVQGSQPSVEKLGMISVIGFDYIDDEKMKMTVIMPQPAPEALEHTQIVTVETDMLHKGLVDISSQADKTVSIKQLRVVLFSKEFAEKGKMKKMVEYLYKDADVRANTFVAVVEESAEEMLTTEYPDKQNTSVYINNVFHPRQYTFFSPFTTVHDFVFDETNPVVDTISPYVEIKDGLIHIKGLAIFNDGKMETMFSKQEGKLIQIMRGQEKISVFYLALTEKEKVAMEFVKSQSKIKTNHSLESPKVKIHLKFEGTLSEYEGDKDLANKEQIETLEKEISKKIEEDTMKLIEKCRDLSIEPIGMFEPLRMRYKGDWPEGLTEELLAKAEVEITVETILMSVGALK
jgi:spore germination protein